MKKTKVMVTTEKGRKVPISVTVAKRAEINRIGDVLEINMPETAEDFTDDVSDEELRAVNTALDEESYSTDIIRDYLRRIGEIPLLTPDEEKALARRIIKGDTSARNELADHNLKLVVAIAKRYIPFITSGVDLMDMIQEGNLGLIKAAEKFDPNKGFKFSTYATWWIKQGITRGIADKSRLIRVPVHAHEKLMKINAFIAAENAEDRKPTIEDIANEFDMTKESVSALMCIGQTPISINKAVGEDEDSSFSDFIPVEGCDPEEDADQKMLGEALNEILDTELRPREALVLRLRFGLTPDRRPMTLEEVGRILGCTRERVRQIESKALRTLQRKPNVRARLEGLGDRETKSWATSY